MWLNVWLLDKDRFPVLFREEGITAGIPDAFVMPKRILYSRFGPGRNCLPDR